jgi:hypothetical protein
MSHKHVVWLGNICGFVLLFCVLSGGRYYLDDLIAIHKTLRDVSLALWTLLLPAWFNIEDRWAPKDPEAKLAFHESQKTGRTIWTVAGAAVLAIVLTR